MMNVAGIMNRSVYLVALAAASVFEDLIRIVVLGDCDQERTAH